MLSGAVREAESLYWSSTSRRYAAETRHSYLTDVVTRAAVVDFDLCSTQCLLERMLCILTVGENTLLP